MKKFYLRVILFWLVLLVLALINAAIRELTYKPLLAPLIGNWAHQISSITGILLFFGAIYWFLKRERQSYQQKDLWVAGLLWLIMTVVFETIMNLFGRGLTFSETLQTYYFWQGETWVFVLLSLVVSPLLANRILKKNKGKKVIFPQ